MLTDPRANRNHKQAPLPPEGLLLEAAWGQSFPKDKIRLRLKYPHFNKEICIDEPQPCGEEAAGCISMAGHCACRWHCLSSGREAADAGGVFLENCTPC